jgi:hypothetical protein
VPSVKSSEELIEVQKSEKFKELKKVSSKKKKKVRKEKENGARKN